MLLLLISLHLYKWVRLFHIELRCKVNPLIVTFPNFGITKHENLHVILLLKCFPPIPSEYMLGTMEDVIP
jgi:hypothetical protein